MRKKILNAIIIFGSSLCVAGLFGLAGLIFTSDKDTGGRDIDRAAGSKVSSPTTAQVSSVVENTESQGSQVAASEVQENDIDQAQSSHTHSYSEATCTSPEKCSCGATKGTALGHSYSEKSCSRCGISNPYYKEPEWSLELPSYPQTLSFYAKNGQVLSTVRLTNITYITDSMFGERIIMVYFYGEKIYDYQGAGQQTECLIHYKLYGPNNNPLTLQPCTAYLGTLKVGETFARSETVLYTDEDEATPGTYRLEIMDAHS